MNNTFKLKITEDNVNLRLDVAISKLLPSEMSRSFLKNHLVDLSVNNKKEKLSYKCKLNDEIVIKINLENFDNIKPEKIDLNIVYEDNNYIVINKKYNMVVHPAKGNLHGTLVNALLGMKKDLYKSDDKLRLGIVHRLDKETSGLIIVAKNKKSHDYLTSLFKKRKIIKKYHAITHGFFAPSYLLIENNIGRHPVNRKKMAVLNDGGKQSITIIEDVKHFNDISYLDISLYTGRTHQIRVHLTHYGFPIIGDLIYSRRGVADAVPLCLAAYKMTFFDIFSNKELDFEIEDPPHMLDLLKKQI